MQRKGTAEVHPCPNDYLTYMVGAKASEHVTGKQNELDAVRVIPGNRRHITNGCAKSLN